MEDFESEASETLDDESEGSEMLDDESEGSGMLDEASRRIHELLDAFSLVKLRYIIKMYSFLFKYLLVFP